MMHRLETHLTAALRRHLAGGKPVMPEAGVLLWNLFMEISASRTYHAAGPHPISFAEIEAYARLNRWPLQPHHVAIIRAMDDTWLEHTYRKMQAGNGHDGHTFDSARYANAHPITAAGFDAVFG